ncbi:unnamed protein product, partial [Symbiodinium sp. KB8]
VWWSALAVAPQLLEFDRVVAFAEDSFWWALGVAHALTGHLLSEAGLLLRLLLVLLGLHGRAGRRVALQELLLFAHSGALALGFVAAAGACAALPGIGPQLQHGAVTALLFYRAFEAVVAPLWWLRSQRLPMAMLNLLVVLAGPLGVGCGMDGSVVIERYRFLESSVEQLRLLGPRQLRYPPNVVYISEHADDADEDSLPSITRELGLDFGGLCRDWLNEVAMGLVSREQGLVEHGLVDGTAFARLKPGGDPQQLEALGKVLGLALRDSQPLGIEMCAPLCHLLTHPRLPTALESIRNIPDTAAARGDIGQPSPSVPAAQTAGFTGRSFELQRLGFSAEWLRWVSQEEYDFWRAMGQTAPFSREALQDVEYSGPPSAEGVQQHMEKKALSSLILDVSPELTALWRGLRAVPDLTLPSLAVEVRGAKRGPPEIPEPSEGPRAKRRRLADRSPLQEMISGGVDVPVTKWQQFTRYSPNKVEQLPAGLRTMRWFWDYVANLSGEERSALLQWITGYRRIPPGGFPAPVPFMTLHLTDASPQRLPTAHTCGLQLDLPRNYGTYDELRIRLSDASLPPATPPSAKRSLARSEASRGQVKDAKKRLKASELLSQAAENAKSDMSKKDAAVDSEELGLVVVGDTSGTATLVDLASGAVRRKLSSEDPILSVATAAPLRAVLGAGGRAVRESSTVAVWDADTGELRAEMQYKKLVTCLIFVPELRAAITGDGAFSQEKPQGRIVLWNPDSLEQHLKLNCASTVTSVAWSGADKVLISADRSHCICLWQPESGAKLQEIRTDAAYVAPLGCIAKQCCNGTSLLMYPAFDQWLIAVPPGEERSTFVYSLCGFKENIGRLCLHRGSSELPLGQITSSQRSKGSGDFDHPVLSAIFLPATWAANRSRQSSHVASEMETSFVGSLIC